MFAKIGEVKVVVVKNVLYELEGDIDDAIKELNLLKEEYAEKYKSLFLEFYSGNYTRLTLFGIRDETEKEKKERLKEEKKKTRMAGEKGNERIKKIAK